MKWQVVRLDGVLEALESGSRPPGGSRAVQTGVPSLGGEHLDDDGGFRLEAIKYIPESHYAAMTQGAVHPYDILLVKDGATTGKTSLVRDDFPFEQAAVNEHVFIVRVNPDLADSRYVFYFLFSPRGKAEILRDHRGATIGGISRAFASQVRLPLPPPSEQRRIVEILDQADRLCRLRAEADAKADRILPALFINMFGDPATNPMGWPMKPLGDLTEHLTSGSRGWSKYTGRGPAYFLRTQDINDGEIAENLLHVDPPDGAEAERTRLAVGDVAITITGIVGKAAMCRGHDRPVYVSQHVALVRPKADELCSEYLAAYANLPLEDVPVLARFQYGQTKPGLGFQELRTARILLPPLERQRAFAKHVNAAQIYRHAGTAASKVLAALWTSLLSRAFSGDLTGSWREAHTKELLQEIERQAKALAAVGPVE